MIFHPALLMILGALVVSMVKGTPRKVLMVAFPLLAFCIVAFQMHPGTYGVYHYAGMELITAKVDKLSLVFLHVFTLMAVIGAIYALHVEDPIQNAAGFLYVAGSLGVTLAGDYLTLFTFWELMAFASTFLIWARRNPVSSAAGYRYLLMHVLGGLILLAGIFLRYRQTGSMAFTAIDPATADTAAYLIMIGMALNAAMVPFHAWLPDAYPEATVTGSVFMCAFTTKTAVYVLARGFSGFEVLAVMGTLMTLFGVGYAVIENDGRRILSYHIISQVGYMVCGVGVGTAMAVNGAVAHAYAHILYKALLFMGVGAVLEMAGTSKLNELGGLYKKMPLTMLGTVIGGIAISGFPLTSGFVSKSMVVTGTGDAHHTYLMLMLLLASVGTFLSVGVKLPYFIFFGEEKQHTGKVAEAKDPPWNMLLAIGIASFYCIYIGIFPDWLYNKLPFPTSYRPYTAYHLSESMQILAFTALGFYLLRKKMKPEPKLNLDVDLFYRGPLSWFVVQLKKYLEPANERLGELYKVVGFRFATATASISSVFDRAAIDGVVDGIAYKVSEIGDKVRHAQTGKIQQYIAIATALFFAAIALVAGF